VADSGNANSVGSEMRNVVEPALARTLILAAELFRAFRPSVQALKSTCRRFDPSRTLQ